MVRRASDRRSFPLDRGTQDIVIRAGSLTLLPLLALLIGCAPGEPRRPTGTAHAAQVEVGASAPSSSAPLPPATPIQAAVAGAPGSESCEELQLDHARVRDSAGRAVCERDEQCRCDGGGVVPVRFCGGVDQRSVSLALQSIRERFEAAGCEGPRCSGQPCSKKLCGTWRCQAVCRDGHCDNALGPREY